MPGDKRDDERGRTRSVQRTAGDRIEDLTTWGRQYGHEGGIKMEDKSRWKINQGGMKMDQDGSRWTKDESRWNEDKS